MSTTVPPPTIWTKLAYGFGAVAYGVKDNGFSYFLLLFYSQVLGIDARLVGFALMLALMLDALSDPIVGYWSDNLRSPLGRRHPFMYAAAAPVALAYYFVWNPPAGLSEADLFLWLLIGAIGVRTLITLYEVPSSALVAELTEDYDQRTSFLSYRHFFGWVGGVTLAVVALAFFLVPTETVANGYFNVAGYGTYGLVAAIMIFVAILVTAAGTHARIPYLKAPPPVRELTLPKIFSEIFETLSDRSFFALFLAVLFGFLAGSISASLNHYLNGFFWEFTTQQVSLLTLSIYVSAIIALVIAPIAGKTFGKKRAAIGIGIVAFTLAPAPYFLRLAGLLPENGDPLLFNIIVTVVTIDVALIIANQILLTSMIADIVEESEVKTGRRSEGIFFAGLSFIRKIVSGLGIMTASLVLALANFPEGAQPGDVPQETVNLLGIIYAPTMLGIWTLMILSLFLYRIDRTRHAENLAAIAARRRAAGPAE